MWLPEVARLGLVGVEGTSPYEATRLGTSEPAAPVPFPVPFPFPVTPAPKDGGIGTDGDLVGVGDGAGAPLLATPPPETVKPSFEVATR
jgi:hypothetical protein